MRQWILWSGLSALTALGLGVPQHAAACSCIPTPIHRSEPAAGAKDVALNQAIMVEGVFRAPSLRLEDESGNPVEFELIAGPWPGCPGTSADVLPKVPLAPNKRYTIRVEPIYPQAVDKTEASTFSFTTGTSMLPDPALERPSGAASVVFDGPEAMCGVGITAYTCLGLDGDAHGLELILRRGEEVLLRTTTLVQDDAVYGVQRAPDCVELRRRAPTGKRSEPFKICGDALNARPWVKRTAPGAFIDCRAGVITNAASSVDAGAPTPPPVTDSLTAGSHAEAGSRAAAGSHSMAGSAGSPESSDPPPSAAGYAGHRTYGCAAANADASGAGAFAVLALMLFARRRLRV